MQIVIDKESLTTLFTIAFYAICGGDYSNVKNTVIELLDKVGYIPLPKGHGDLVDFDKLCREYWDGNYMEIHRNDLQSIKPIIEADTESEEKV